MLEELLSNLQRGVHLWLPYAAAPALILLFDRFIPRPVARVAAPVLICAGVAGFCLLLRFVETHTAREQLQSARLLFYSSLIMTYLGILFAYAYVPRRYIWWSFPGILAIFTLVVGFMALWGGLGLSCVYHSACP